MLVADNETKTEGEISSVQGALLFDAVTALVDVLKRPGAKEVLHLVRTIRTYQKALTKERIPLLLPEELSPVLQLVGEMLVTPREGHSDER